MGILLFIGLMIISSTAIYTPLFKTGSPR